MKIAMEDTEEGEEEPPEVKVDIKKAYEELAYQELLAEIKREEKKIEEKKRRLEDLLMEITLKSIRNAKVRKILTKIGNPKVKMYRDIIEDHSKESEELKKKKPGSKEHQRERWKIKKKRELIDLLETDPDIQDWIEERKEDDVQEYYDELAELRKLNRSIVEEQKELEGKNKKKKQMEENISSEAEFDTAYKTFESTRTKK